MSSPSTSAAGATHASPTPGEPVMREAVMHLYKPNDPVEVPVIANQLCTAGKKAAGVVRHIVFDVTGTALEGKVLPGQSLGVIPPGVDANGKPHKLRLYSVSHPARGEDGHGRHLAITVKRAIDEHWDNHTLFLGVCSNYLCDRQVGDKVKITGPSGKRFVLPADPHAHDYLFIATGTGIAPFRGMLLDLVHAGFKGQAALLMGTPYATDLLYHQALTDLAKAHPNFHYLTAISREANPPHAKLYVQERLRTDAERLMPLLRSPRTLIYVCGLAGMELGIFQELARLLPADALEQYLRVDPAAMADIGAWQRSMLHKQIHPTKRVFLEVYA
jgi:ferredoxin--NADP+ reductase